MNKGLIVIAAVLGIMMLLIAGVYFFIPANVLPAFLPGYDTNQTKVHYKHGIGALGLSLAVFAFAWFQSGKKSPPQEYQGA